MFGSLPFLEPYSLVSMLDFSALEVSSHAFVRSVTKNDAQVWLFQSQMTHESDSKWSGTSCVTKNHKTWDFLGALGCFFARQMMILGTFSKAPGDPI